MDTFQFKATDGTDLFVRRFCAPNEKTVVVFLGGVESHGGWYEKSLTFLQANGVTAYFLDRRGSGQSAGERGDLRSVQQLLDDLSDFATHVALEHAEKPLVLSAISWGAKWALLFWKFAKINLFHSLVLITPGLYRKVDLTFREKGGACFCAVLKSKHLFPIPIQTPFFTRTPEKLDFLEKDPYRLHYVTARFLKVNYEIDQILKGYEGIYPQPLRIFFAGQDLIVDNSKAVIFLKSHFFDLKSYVYPESRHTLEFEENITFEKDLLEAVLG